MIEVQGLSRRYGDLQAVQDVSFSVSEGEILGILGPNGAGKTTTIRMITGYLPPSAGRVTVAGKDLLREGPKARRQLGYLPESVPLYPEMRVSEYLTYRAKLEGLSRSQGREAMGEALERCLLKEVAGQIIGTLSKGYRQRVGLAAAILHGPEVLVLDEPTVGLDPKQIIAIRELIRELGKTRTLLLSTHILPEVEQLCDRVVIFDRGRLVAEGSPKELAEQVHGTQELRVVLSNVGDEADAQLAELEGVDRVRDLSDEAGSEPGARTLQLRSASGRDLREAVFRLAVARDWVLLELAQRRLSLEDVFVRLTTRDTPQEQGEEPTRDSEETARAEDEAETAPTDDAAGVDHDPEARS